MLSWKKKLVLETQAKNEFIDLYSKKLNECIEKSAEIRQYETENDNLHLLCKDNSYYKVIDFWRFDNTEIIAYMANYDKRNDKIEADFLIKDLFGCDFKDNFTYISCASVSIEKKVLEILSMDTGAFERQGFGSRCLKYIEDFAGQESVIKIHGELLESTHIGLDNLIHFYRKNGYKIIKKDNAPAQFYKSLV